MKNILEIENVRKSFENTVVLKDINFQVREGEFIAIMGPSGSGKSTLLYTISGMHKPTSGKVFFRGKDIASLKDWEISEIRLKKMGFVFQHSHLLKNLSIRDNIVLPGFKSGKETREQVVTKAHGLMVRTGIIEVADHDIKKVSGGQLQRAAICRALINNPEIIFGDEPTGALNSAASKEIMDILNSINQEGTTVIIVTHDAKVAARADRVIFLMDGKIQAELKIEKYEKDDDKTQREKQIFEWLERQGF